LSSTAKRACSQASLVAFDLLRLDEDSTLASVFWDPEHARHTVAHVSEEVHRFGWS
jgi:hypothetical protein